MVIIDRALVVNFSGPIQGKSNGKLRMLVGQSSEYLGRNPRHTCVEVQCALI